MADMNQMRSFVSAVLARDGYDLEAVKDRIERQGLEAGSETATLEAIVSLHRPVFAIVQDRVDTTVGSDQADAEVVDMAQLVKDKAAVINQIIPAVGRIDLPDDENYPWVGTGWVIDSELGDDIAITNAHVAQLFAERSSSGFNFKSLPFLERPEAPVVDFRREMAEANTLPRRFKVLDVIYIGTPGLIDVAFLRVARSGDGVLSAPIKLAMVDPATNLPVATIGYPGTVAVTTTSQLSFGSSEMCSTLSVAHPERSLVRIAAGYPTIVQRCQEAQGRLYSISGLERRLDCISKVCRSSLITPYQFRRSASSLRSSHGALPVQPMRSGLTLRYPKNPTRGAT
jgi:hypothetical protein